MLQIKMEFQCSKCGYDLTMIGHCPMPKECPKCGTPSDEPGKSNPRLEWVAKVDIPPETVITWDMLAWKRVDEKDKSEKT